MGEVRFVTIGSKVNGKYKAKEEMSLEEFFNKVNKIAENIVFPESPLLPKINYIDVLFRTKKYKTYMDIKIKDNALKMLRNYNKAVVFIGLKKIIDADKPGKKILKKR